MNSVSAPTRDVTTVAPQALAVLNEIVWRTQSTDVWVSFKVFGVVPLTFLFGALQYPLLTKYAAPEAKKNSE